MSKMSIYLNYLFAKGDKQRDKGLTTPDDIVRFDNISYGKHGKWNKLDVYRPKNVDIVNKLPVIVSVHGGGWVYGTKEVYQFYCMNLAQRGFAVINFNYRLAPRNKFPACMEDTNAVFTWLMDNANNYGFDIEHVFAVGDSAGAHMLSLYAGILTNPECASLYNFTTPKDLKLTGIALNCGVYEVPKNRNELMDALMSDLLPHKGNDEELYMVTPLNFITSNYLNTFVMAANDDELAGNGLNLVEMLKEKGINYKYKIYGNEQCPLQHVFHVNIKTDEAKKCNDEECDFFKSLM